ncbi:MULTISPECIES: hybrid sensor histidine kinase/response regulator [Cyanophyceae]|uniref:histidine kinase n=1 Tax=Leptolyngbya subtilissima DQ-A4 TaxID=2933933 RepID=A0ABV0KA60_9CYAN|nr:PAS domain S-box protein [Nodosilinea sp. FACHB-141]MBD2115159.1 PAS domain S-box protein [Nodosilinea sp. FACHB-141]
MTSPVPIPSPRLTKRFVLAGLALAFATDTLTPLGFAHANLYPLIVAAAGFSRSDRWVRMAAVASLGLTVAGFFVSPPAPPDFAIAYVIGNRLLAAMTIAITSGLTLEVLRYIKQVDTSQQALSDAYDTLNSQRTLLQIAGEIGRIGGWLVPLNSPTVIWSEEVCRIHEVESGFAPTLAQAIEFYSPEYRDRIATVVTACIETGLPFDEELQIITARQRRVWVRAIGQPVRDDQGEIVAIQGAFQDITAQKQAEESLEHSEQRFRQLADAMPLLVWTAEPDGTIDYTCYALRVYTGIYEPEPHPGQTWPMLLHPDDRDPCLAAWTAALQSSMPYRFELRLRRYDGDYRWHQVQAVPVRDQDGTIIKWYGTAVEIHEQKQLEHKARQTADHLNTTLESITDAFFTLDHEWRFTFLNRQAEELLQRRRSDLLGKYVSHEFPEAVGSVFHQQFETAIKEGRSVEFREFYSPLNAWLDVRAYPSSEGLTVYFRDVTERLALEEQLHQSQRLESIGQLTGGIAHDFNNLLTVILGNAELLSEMLAPDPRLQPLAEMIASAAQRGANLTQRLLAFARRQALAPEAVDVNQLMTTMDGLLRRTLGEHIDIEMVLEAGLWPALVDPVQLESALLNLCLNARDAMIQGGQLTLETANTDLTQDYTDQQAEVAPGPYVMMTVSDTGLGITPENLERVFEPFFTTKEKGKGTGLGLSMVYGFIKQSGGHIKLYSEPGQGTTIKMYLPRFSGDTGPQPRQVDSSVVGGSELILLVEDDELVRRYAHDQLVDLGYRVLVATNGPTALILLRQRDDIDLLFTDMVMPGGMSGRELAYLTRRFRPELKVLYTSGYSENTIVHQGRLDPGVQLLSKPYGRVKLSQKIRDALAAPH